MKYIVYQTTNKINNKIYIGVHKTEDPEIFDGYIGCGVIITSPSSYMKPYTPFQSAVKKYGTSNFRRVTLKIFDNQKDAYKLESELVNYDFINRDDTYNMALGGQGGNQAFVKINQFSLNGELIKKWNSIMEACEFLGVCHTAIYRAYKEHGSCLRYFWSTENSIDISDYKASIGTTCYKYNSKGKCVAIYNSLTEASKDNECLLSVMERAVKGGYTIKGYNYSSVLYDVYVKKEKISLKGKTLYVYNLNGEFITELSTTEDIKNYFKIKSTNTINAALRIGRPYKEFQLSLIKKESLPKVISKKNVNKTVGCYTEGGDLIETFSSIEKAVHKYGFGVRRCVRGVQQQCKGFIFKIIS